MDNRTEGIGMEFNETQTMAINFTKMAKEKWGIRLKIFAFWTYMMMPITEHSAWNLQHMIIFQ